MAGGSGEAAALTPGWWAGGGERKGVVNIQDIKITHLYKNVEKHQLVFLEPQDNVLKYQTVLSTNQREGQRNQKYLH